ERAVGQHTFPSRDRARTPPARALRCAAPGRENSSVVWNDRRMQQENKSSRFLTLLRRRVRRTIQAPLGSQTAAFPASTAGARGSSAGTGQTSSSDAEDDIRPGSIEELRGIRAQIAQLEAHLEAADQEREALKAERLHLQQVLGAQHGKRVLPRLKVEKTNGVASLVAGARMMQRVHAKADDPDAGI